MVYREKRERGVTRLTGAPPTPLDSWPIGAVYTSISVTDPGTIFGGTWVRFAQGRMLIGLNESDTQFDTPQEVGGAKTHVLSEAETADHTHGLGTGGGETDTGEVHSHAAGGLTLSLRAGTGSAAGAAKGNTTLAGDAQVQNSTGTSGSGHKHQLTGNTGTGSGQNQPHNNLPPYIAVYMWRRTA